MHIKSVIQKMSSNPPQSSLLVEPHPPLAKKKRKGNENKKKKIMCIYHQIVAVHCPSLLVACFFASGPSTPSSFRRYIHTKSTSPSTLQTHSLSLPHSLPHLLLSTLSFLSKCPQKHQHPRQRLKWHPHLPSHHKHNRQHQHHHRRQPNLFRHHHQHRLRNDQQHHH